MRPFGELKQRGHKPQEPMSRSDYPFPVKERDPKLYRYDLPRYAIDEEGYYYMEPLRTQDLPEPPPSNAIRSHKRLMAALVCVVLLASVMVATATVIMMHSNEISGGNFDTSLEDITYDLPHVMFHTPGPSDTSYHGTSQLYSADFNESITVSQSEGKRTEPTIETSAAETQQNSSLS